MVSAEEIIRDRKILERESFLRLSRISYLHSKLLVLFLISAIQTFTFVIVGNSILEIQGMLFHYWAILFSVACLANVLGLNISSGLNSVVSAYILIPLLIVPQFLFSGVTIKFDRLNNIIDHPAYVPVIGELMPTRWAYESLAVHQFKSNKYNRELFPYDQLIENADFQTDYLIKGLVANLDNLYFKHSNNTALSEFEKDFALLRNEIGKLSSLEDIEPYAEIDKLTKTQFSETTYASAKVWLQEISDVFNAQRLAAARQKDKKYAELVEAWGGKEAYIKMKDAYTNDRLKQIVTNKHDLRATVEWNGQLIRKIDPIYMEPSSRIGRAHFYAPVKKLGNLSISTYWFNMIVIWLFAYLYYLALVYDLLRRFSNWNRVRQLRRK
jgi:hypothetical protein